MVTITLPKKALERVHIGQAFAEYDIIRNDPELFVSTPSTIAALNPDAKKCFYVGRRGTGKTAITYEIQRRAKHSILITPQIFDLLELPLAHEEFKDTRQRPFKSLMHTMERALLDETLRQLFRDRIISTKELPNTISRERNLIEDLDFDQRVLSLSREIFDAYSKDQDKLWLRQISRSKELIEEINSIDSLSSVTYHILIDRLDESWDGSDSAIITLMALMHAAVRLMAATKTVRPSIFIRENIYDRIRAIDNEFSRLETAVTFLEWSEPKLVELVERRLVRPFPTKPKLGGEAWRCFFEDSADRSSIEHVMELSQHRPRDVLMLTSYAIEAAINNSHEKIAITDLGTASQRYSTSRLKDLGDEFSENYPNINILLELFYGLGVEYSVIGVEDFISKLLVNDKIKKYCNSWIYDYTTPFRFIGLLYDIGFFGLKRRERIVYKEFGRDANTKLSIDSTTNVYIHPTYQPALNLRQILVQKMDHDLALRHEGLLDDLPENYRFDEYKDELRVTLHVLKSLSTGKNDAAQFEDIVGQIIKLCFFRALTNAQPKCRTHDGSQIRDWVASNRATGGFWEVIRTKYGSTQIVWECKNYTDLTADDFHQVNYYLNSGFGHFGVIAFRGSEIKESYLKHISNISARHQGGAMILVLTQKDLEVFLRQAINGHSKESHIQERFDYFVRSLA